MVIRIFIIDEHRAAREMLACRLSSLPDMDILGTTGTAAMACAISSSTKVPVLTPSVDLKERRMALQAGVRGYLIKEVDTPRLALRIRQLACPEGCKSKSHT